MKTLILLDEAVSIPLPLADKDATDGKTILNPIGEVNDLLAEKLVKTYPLKYAIYDEGNAEHKRLLVEGKYPEATKIVTNELDVNFALLTREEKLKVVDYVKAIKSGKASKKIDANKAEAERLKVIAKALDAREKALDKREKELPKEDEKVKETIIIPPKPQA